jgi:ribonucleoside-diphosphate reductase alpha chain
MDNSRLTEVNPLFEAVAKQRGFYNEALMNIIAENNSIQEMEEIPQDIRDIFVTAHDVSPDWHIKMQAAFQKHTDNAVSKTVNLPAEATVEDVRHIYYMAFQTGCKGITIYRDGSKKNQVLSTGGAKLQKPEKIAGVKDRPETLEGFTTKIKTGMGHLYVTVTELEGKPFEVFATIGKSGKSTTAKTEAIGRLISLALRAGVDVKDVIEQVKGIGGEFAVFQNGGRVLSIPDAIGRVLEDRYKDKDWTTKSEQSFKRESCPDCGTMITYEEGCKKCHACGFSECS